MKLIIEFSIDKCFELSCSIDLRTLASGVKQNGFRTPRMALEMKLI